MKAGVACRPQWDIRYKGDMKRRVRRGVRKKYKHRRIKDNVNCGADKFEKWKDWGKMPVVREVEPRDAGDGEVGGSRVGEREKG